MAKQKIKYVCQNCGTTFAKWMGQCSSCGKWNTIAEEAVEQTPKGKTLKPTEEYEETHFARLDNFNFEESERTSTSDSELDLVLGGGLVAGSLILIGGEPGIGKSTLLLQTALNIKNKKILYVSGEESIAQIKMRASRIGGKNANCLLLAETDLANTLSAIKKVQPDLVIIDSIQTMAHGDITAAAGSITQIRECTAAVMQVAKKKGITFLLVGHINKDGMIAGPKVMEHMVDTVLYFEGERTFNFRVLRSTKNRFGAVEDIGIYEMRSSGLKPVLNPSTILMADRSTDISGTTTVAMLEGMKVFMAEVEALVSPSHYGTPQRSTTGFDNKRMAMLLAVLEKRCGLKLGNQDVFLNITGGIKINDPSTDLGVACAIASSHLDMPIDPFYCFAGELGLSGEIRPVRQIERRMAEAEKLGFKKIMVSGYSKIPKKKATIEVHAFKKLNEVIRFLFSNQS